MYVRRLQQLSDFIAQHPEQLSMLGSHTEDGCHSPAGLTEMLFIPKWETIYQERPHEIWGRAASVLGLNWAFAVRLFSSAYWPQDLALAYQTARWNLNRGEMARILRLRIHRFVQSHGYE